MNEFAIEALTVVNFIALVLLLVLVGAILFSMARRLYYYRVAEEPVPTLLKRGFVLFTALAVIGVEAGLLRWFRIDLQADPVFRLFYVIQTNAILLTALGYYAKAELFDVDDPDKP